MKKPKPIPLERILTITNDVSEDIDNPITYYELWECVRYWSTECAKAAAGKSTAEFKLKLISQLST